MSVLYSIYVKEERAQVYSIVETDESQKNTEMYPFLAFLLISNSSRSCDQRGGFGYLSGACPRSGGIGKIAGSH